MKQNFLVRTNYFNHYSLRAWIAHLFLIGPTGGVLLLVVFWGSLDFIWVVPGFVVLGLLMFLPTFSYFNPTSQERVVVESLFVAVMMLACLVLSIAETLRINSTNSTAELLESTARNPQRQTLLKHESKDLGQNDQTGGDRG